MCLTKPGRQQECGIAFAVGGVQCELLKLLINHPQH